MMQHGVAYTEIPQRVQERSKTNLSSKENTWIEHDLKSATRRMNFEIPPSSLRAHHVTRKTTYLHPFSKLRS